jgi:50S ribosomal subunit-associated GTPase HflX
VRLYSEVLAGTPHVLLLTKRDLLPPDAPLPIVHAPDAAGTLAISSAAGTGLDELKEFLWTFLERTRSAAAEAGTTPPALDVPGYWEFMDDE